MNDSEHIDLQCFTAYLRIKKIEKNLNFRPDILILMLIIISIWVSPLSREDFRITETGLPL